MPTRGMRPIGENPRDLFGQRHGSPYPDHIPAEWLNRTGVTKDTTTAKQREKRRCPTKLSYHPKTAMIGVASTTACALERECRQTHSHLHTPTSRRRTLRRTPLSLL